MDDIFKIDEIYQGLQTISGRAFPKTCPTCGKTYASVEAFLAETQGLRKTTGLKSSIDDDDRLIVELFRNCTCGSTLLETFGDRRDHSAKGIKARENFGRILNMLMADGYPREMARDELLKLTRGQGSQFISDWFARKKADKRRAKEQNSKNSLAASGSAGE